jgi:arginyl-tRNA synthetase
MFLKIRGQFVQDILTDCFKQAISTAYGNEISDCDPSIKIASRREYGDYQANFAMRLAKLLGKKPLDVANGVIEKLKDNPIFKSLEASGPGFINITLTNDFLSERLATLVNDERLGVKKEQPAERVVVDYANANVAKEMHVGHIRSIVIGDAIVRILSFLGHETIRQSHLGDWGTQFGMLIEYLVVQGIDPYSYSVTDLDVLYKKSKQEFDANPDFAENARKRVVALQQGDETTLSIWKHLVKESLGYFQKIYDSLDVLITEEDARGESFYNDMLANVIEELEQQGLVQTSDDAKVIFLDEFTIPFLIRKKDGGYLYATTDLAAAKFRIETLGAHRIIYLTDARQKQHFAMLFAAVSKAKWLETGVRLEHFPFGAILGPDNKPFKTRSGEVIRLIELIKEAESRAMQLAQEKNPQLTQEQLEPIAHAIGIGALKYADLRADKVKDYVFDWDKALSFEGNTAPYLQNAYVRIQAVFRKGNVDLSTIAKKPLLLTTDLEHGLAIKLLEFSDLLHSVADDLSLHRLCDYLHDLAATFHRFYEQCPILSNKDEAIRDSRLLLADITARTLKLGLNLLGIKTIEQM